MTTGYYGDVVSGTPYGAEGSEYAISAKDLQKLCARRGFHKMVPWPHDADEPAMDILNRNFELMVNEGRLFDLGEQDHWPDFEGATTHGVMDLPWPYPVFCFMKQESGNTVLYYVARFDIPGVELFNAPASFAITTYIGTQEPGDRPRFITIGTCLYRDAELVPGQHRTIDCKLPNTEYVRRAIDQEALHQWSGSAAADLYFLLQMLDRPRVPKQVVQTDARENRQRAREGKRRLGHYTRLDFIAYRDAEAERQSKGGTHASPATHERRGHSRRLRSGVVVTVRSTVVNPGHGPVTRSHYEVNPK